MGVSYAPPTYYADCLCERGRCYLRQFFSPDGPTKDEWDKKRREFQAGVRKKRDAKNEEAGVDEKERRGKRKTERQLKEERADREEVDRMMYKAIKGPVLARWNVDPVDDVAADRKEDHLETMYWM